MDDDNDMKIPRLKHGDSIEVVWIDAHFRTDKGWMDEGEVSEDIPVYIRSVCQFRSLDKEYLNTVADISDTEPEGVMRDLRIPLGCIKSIRKLK